MPGHLRVQSRLAVVGQASGAERRALARPCRASNPGKAASCGGTHDAPPQCDRRVPAAAHVPSQSRLKKLIARRIVATLLVHRPCPSPSRRRQPRAIGFRGSSSQFRSVPGPPHAETDRKQFVPPACLARLRSWWCSIPAGSLRLALKDWFRCSSSWLCMSLGATTLRLDQCWPEVGPLQNAANVEPIEEKSNGVQVAVNGVPFRRLRPNHRVAVNSRLSCAEC